MTQAVHDLLEQHFDTVFASPDGIAKLRELILTLAMKGKLVEQNPNDPSASELLKAIEKEKQQFVKVGKIKKPKALPPIEQADAPYALPKGWIWTRLGNIGNIFNGNSINAIEKETKYAGANGLPYIATKDVGYGLDELDYKNGIYIPESEEKFKIAHQGAVLICAEGGSAGKKCGIAEQDVCFGNKLFANEPYGGISSKFILYLYLSPLFREAFAGAMAGIIGGVSIAKFMELPIPIPPLREQHRIVTRIDQLMDRCDEMERLKKSLDERRIAVNLSAIRKLLDDDFDAGRSFIEQNFFQLYSVKENVAELRNAILQLAVMGRLVPQDPSAQSADWLLKEIEEEKLRLINEKKIKKQKSLREISSDEAPFSLPRGWVWCRVASCIDSSRDISYGIIKLEAEPKAGGIPTLRCSDVKPGYIELANVRSVSPEVEAPYVRTRLQGGEVLVNIRGTLGGVALVPKELAGYNIAREVAMLPVHPRISANYMVNVIASPFFWRMIEANLKGIAYKGLNLNILRDFVIPLPPHEEQVRIVSRVKYLMELCDSLDREIRAATRKQGALLNAVMAQV